MTKLALIWLSLLCFACGSTTPKEPTLTKEQQTDACRPAADHLVAILLHGETGSVPLADRIRTALLDRCVGDRWGADAVACFRKIELIDQAEGCAKYLTIPQRDGFQQAIESAAS